MATHSSVLAWRIPGTAKPGGLLSMGSQSRTQLKQLSSSRRTVPLSMEFSRQEYWSGLPFSSPGDLPNQEIKPDSPALQADCLPSEPPGRT